MTYDDMVQLQKCMLSTDPDESLQNPAKPTNHQCDLVTQVIVGLLGCGMHRFLQIILQVLETIVVSGQLAASKDHAGYFF